MSKMRHFLPNLVKPRGKALDIDHIAHKKGQADRLAFDPWQRAGYTAFRAQPQQDTKMADKSDRSKWDINTILTHSGNNPRDFHGFVNPPVVRASTVLYPDSATMEGQKQKYTYGTHGTPTTDALASAIDELEGSAGTVIVSSGLVAVTLPLLAFLKSGDHLLMLDSVYFPTRRFCDSMLIDLDVEVTYYDPLIGADIEALIQPNTKVVFTESPGSNTKEMQDIPAIAEIAQKHGAVVMMDNTWATPL